MINKGLVLAMGAAVAFSLMNLMVKELSMSMGSGEIVFGRSVVGVVILLAIMKKYDIRFSRKDIPALIFRGTVGGVSMFLIFIAISGMHLGDVSILQQLSAIFVVFLSAVWLKEKIPADSVRPLLIIVTGTVLLLRPWEYDSFSGYALLAILSAFLAAVAYTTIHKLFENGGHSSWEIVFYFLFFSMLIGAASTVGNCHYPDAREAVLLSGIGIVSLAAQALMTQAYGMANAVLVSFVLYLGVFFNALWGYLFFGEVMHSLSIAGGILIIGGSIYLTLAKQRGRRNRIRRLRR